MRLKIYKFRKEDSEVKILKLIKAKIIKKAKIVLHILVCKASKLFLIHLLIKIIKVEVYSVLVIIKVKKVKLMLINSLILIVRKNNRYLKNTENLRVTYINYKI